ncbi:Glucose-6-phosphate isomerase, archaeal II [Candidatus Syntrophocurvum alkaliphilum]|uniref:Glucose-6-phosphate isomerase, archaeal II n=1 Tax=Candidatus Syntrophocurvum alkaliphilum TaxID=2293317 RepID=A0A6I6DM51_9FIRM|nr:bifunctional phosphoglucose/phosphomannose isomerase [Candidatus Syntrophocurvum alkaliphilum]QGU00371.1 Glucose-6-phosphate isomerase, archaeal II [Candidatus Syntrophocurvum alkaliphilum]
MTPEKMMEYLFNLPNQFKESMDIDLNFLAQYKKSYKNIVVSGLGGSAIGGDILRTYALKKASSPIIINRDYDIPEFVDNESLVLAVSYSGNTEETLSSYEKAKNKGATIIAFTTGGKLGEMANADGFPVVNIPGGLVPRAATGYLFAPVALAMEKIGVLSNVKEEIDETYNVLLDLRDSLNPDIDSDDNKAKTIAQLVKGHIPVIWGCAGTSEVAAMRWKGQINENAKCPAYFNVIPELNHNEIVGFELPEEILDKIAVILLRDDNDNERNKLRMDTSKDIIKDKVGSVIEVQSEGQSYLARIYSLIYIGDYASYYLALEYNVNPTPVKVIDYLKGELALAKA